MKRFTVLAVLLFAAVVGLAQSPQTMTWTDVSGMAGTCIQVSTENGQSVSTGYYYCPEQSTSFSSPYCPDPSNGICYGSLYLPDATIEDITTTYGGPFNQSKDSKGRVTAYSRTDQLVQNGEGTAPTTWSGSITQSFRVTYGAYNFRCRCYPATTTVLAGETGTLTAAQ